MNINPLPVPKNLNLAPPIDISEIDPKDPLQIGIFYHDQDYLEIAVYYFSISASKGDPMGLVLYAICLRHGFGVEKNEHLAVSLLKRATETTVAEIEYLNDRYKAGSLKQPILEYQKKMLISSELVLAVYELAMSFKQGWGVKQSSTTAVYYLLLAAQLGDVDAQLEMGECYLRGEGVVKDKKKAAKWFRIAEKNGARMVSMHWIWKPKYDETEE
jgi:TPR repeat protein